VSLVTVWATVSLFTHVTVSPCRIVIVFGLKAKFAIEIVMPPAELFTVLLDELFADVLPEEAFTFTFTELFVLVFAIGWPVTMSDS